MEIMDGYYVRKLFFNLKFTFFFKASSICSTSYFSGQDSMRMLIHVFVMPIVVKKTIIEKKNVHIGSTIIKSGLMLSRCRDSLKREEQLKIELEKLQKRNPQAKDLMKDLMQEISQMSKQDWQNIPEAKNSFFKRVNLDNESRKERKSLPLCLTALYLID